MTTDLITTTPIRALPKSGDVEVINGQRQAWDATSNQWRILSKKHCPEHINPFAPGYKPVPPFESRLFKTSDRRPKMVLSDAHGIRLRADGSINTHYYPPGLKMLMAGLGKEKKPGRGKTWEKTAQMFWRLAKHDKHFDRFFADDGTPKLEMTRALFLQIINLIFNQPKIQGKFMEQLHQLALEDPLKTFQLWQSLAGNPPMQIGIMQNGTTQAVGINIFQRDEAEPLPEIVEVKGELVE